MKFMNLWKFLMAGAIMRMGIIDGDAGGAAGDGDSAAAAADAGKGAPVVSDNEAKLLKEVMQKKDALKKASDELADVKTKLAAFDGIDATAVKELLAERKKAEESQLEAKGEWDRLRARMAEEHTREVDAIKSATETLRAELAKKDAVISNLSVGAQFGQSKFIAEELTLTPSKARVVYGEYFDVSEDGSVVGYDKPRGSANRTALINGVGSNLSFDEALRKIVESDPEKDHMLKSKMKPGAGSDTKPGTKPAAKPVETDSVSKIAQGLKLFGR